MWLKQWPKTVVYSSKSYCVAQSDMLQYRNEYLLTSLTLHTPGCLRVCLRDYFSSSSSGLKISISKRRVLCAFWRRWKWILSYAEAIASKSTARPFSLSLPTGCIYYTYTCIRVLNFIGEFDLAKRDYILHPVWSKVWWIRMDVYRWRSIDRGWIWWIWGGWKRVTHCSTWRPLSTCILPSTHIYLHEVHDEWIDDSGNQSGNSDADHRKHSSEISANSI